MSTRYDSLYPPAPKIYADPLVRRYAYVWIVCVFMAIWILNRLPLSWGLWITVFLIFTGIVSGVSAGIGYTRGLRKGKEEGEG